MLTAPALALALVAVTGAGVVTGLTGFGFALVSVPLLLWVMDPPSVVTAVLVIGQLTSSVNAWTSRQHVEGRILRTLLPGAVAGMVAGSYVLRVLDPTALKLTAAALVVVFTLLLAVRRRPGRRPPPAAETLVGGASGVLTTSVGLSGPPVVLLMSGALPDKHRSRATLAAYFALTSPLGLVTLLVQGSAPWHAWQAAAVLAPIALLGRAVGSRLHRSTPQGVFRVVSLGITLAAGLGGMAAALATLLGHS
ncbi:MAG: sulfite exporter TauE/SafE family protein [Deinococcales bacterium]